LKNPGFDVAPVTYNTAGTLNTSAVNMWNGLGYTSAYAYNLTNWTNRSVVVSNSTFTATFAYGSTATFNAIAIPKTDKNGVNTGACLGISSGWGTGNAVQFTQKTLMPAGKYIMNYDAYNGNTSAATVITNLTGFKGATNIYDANTSFTASVWTTPSIAATFTSPFQGEISIGASCSNAGSGAGPKLLVDNIKILTDQPIESVESFLWNAAKDSAQVAMNKYPALNYGTLYTNLQTALQQTYSTINECATAIQNLKDATAQFLAGAPLYAGTEDVLFQGDENEPVAVYNVLGQLVLEKKYTRSNVAEHLKTGLYIIGNRKVFVSK